MEESNKVQFLIKTIKQKMKKADIARMVGVSWCTVRLWERGVFQPRKKTKEKLMTLYENLRQ